MSVKGDRGLPRFNLLVHSIVLLVTVLGLALPAAAATREILFSYNASGKEEELLKEVVAEFVAAHPGANVRMENIVGPHGGQWFDQLLVRLASGVDVPDVYLMELNKALGLIGLNRIMALDALIKKDGVDVGDLVPAGLQGVSYQGRIYGLPSRVDAAMFYANMDLLARAGLNLPKNDWTLEEFRQAAGRMTQDVNGDRVVDVWGTDISGVRFLFAAWQTIFGGKILDSAGNVVLDRPASVNALEAVLELVSGYQVAPNPVAIPQGVGFPQGNVGFWYNYTFQIQNLRQQAARLNWEILPQPVGPAGAGNILLGNMFMIDSRTKQADLAWELVKHLYSSKVQERFVVQIGSIFPRRSFFASNVYARNSLVPRNWAAVRDAYSVATSYPSIRQLERVRTLLNGAAASALDRKETAQAALQNAAAAIRLELKK